MGATGYHSFVEKAVQQLNRHARDEVLQLHSASYPSASQPRTVGVGVRSEASEQNVAQHRRSHGPRLVPGPHGYLIHRLAAGEVEPFTLLNMVNQHPFDVRQRRHVDSPSSHTSTIEEPRFSPQCRPACPEPLRSGACPAKAITWKPLIVMLRTRPPRRASSDTRSCAERRYRSCRGAALPHMPHRARDAAPLPRVEWRQILQVISGWRTRATVVVGLSPPVDQPLATAHRPAHRPRRGLDIGRLMGRNLRYD